MHRFFTDKTDDTDDADQFTYSQRERKDYENLFGVVRTYSVDGTWDGATATLYISYDGGSEWAASTIFTANGVDNIEVSGYPIFNVVLSSSGGSTSLSARIT